MKTTTRLALGALLIAALAHFTAGTAFADKLWPPDSDSTASGSARTSYDGPYYPIDGGETSWKARTKLTVRGLRPNAVYQFVVADNWVSYEFYFQTNYKGEAAGTYVWDSYAPRRSPYYWVLDSTGAIVLAN